MYKENEPSETYINSSTQNLEEYKPEELSVLRLLHVRPSEKSGYSHNPLVNVGPLVTHWRDHFLEFRAKALHVLSFVRICMGVKDRQIVNNIIFLPLR